MRLSEDESARSVPETSSVEGAPGASHRRDSMRSSYSIVSDVEMARTEVHQLSLTVHHSEVCINRDLTGL
jgi:hypothetical protein